MGVKSRKKSQFIFGLCFRICKWVENYAISCSGYAISLGRISLKDSQEDMSGYNWIIVQKRNWIGNTNL